MNCLADVPVAVSWGMLFVSSLTFVFTLFNAWKSHQLKVEIDRTRLSLDLTTHVHDLKREVYFAFVAAVEDILLAFTKILDTPSEKHLDLFSSNNLAQSLMKVHLVATHELTEQCLNFGKWYFETLPTLTKRALEIREKAEHEMDVRRDVIDFRRYLVSTIIDCRRRMLPVMREMRKELGICFDKWAEYEGVWMSFLERLPQATDTIFNNQEETLFGKCG